MIQIMKASRNTVLIKDETDINPVELATDTLLTLVGNNKLAVILNARRVNSIIFIRRGINNKLLVYDDNFVESAVYRIASGINAKCVAKLPHDSAILRYTKPQRGQRLITVTRGVLREAPIEA